MSPQTRQPPTSAPQTPAGPGGMDEGRVPLFGSWRAIHAAVLLCAAVVIALLALFSRWPF